MQTEEKVIFGEERRKSSSCDVRFLKMETAPRGDSAYSFHFNFLFSLQYTTHNGMDGAEITHCVDCWRFRGVFFGDPVQKNVSEPMGFGLALIHHVSGEQVPDTGHFQ